MSEAELLMLDLELIDLSPLTLLRTFNWLSQSCENEMS